MTRAAILLAGFAVACSTLAETAGGDSNLPSAGVGPFRKLGATEVKGGPLVLDDSTLLYREPCALALGSGTTDVALYVVEKDAPSGHDVIARTRATDARDFYGAPLDVGHHPPAVLASDQAWEGPDLAHPSAVAVPGGVWLYYASNGSIGLARSTDGLAFTKASAPALAADASGPIDSASVAVLPDGTFDMMYAQSGAIWEATSADGATFQRTGAPVLEPAPPATSLETGQLPPFDTLRVADPFVSPRMTPAGRLQIRVLYTGYAQGEAGVTSAIGFAARYGTSGALARASGAVFAIGKNESSPTFFEYADGSFLYVEEDGGGTTGPSYRAVGAAVAPATLVLPAPDPNPYPDSP